MSKEKVSFLSLNIYGFFIILDSPQMIGFFRLQGIGKRLKGF